MKWIPFARYVAHEARRHLTTAIEHLVLIKPKPDLSPEVLAELVRGAQALAHAGIPGLIELSAGLNESPRGAGYAIGLRALLADDEALAGYAVHPVHLKYIEQLNLHTVDRLVADYKVPNRA